MPKNSRLGFHAREATAALGQAQ
ncbi:uncharacterized protein METZ01_LOCUS224108 [marine metagenome]|uniref:Uncharacterized protein n=1 Tax=marine metagenome TaxID=408172 RepID=A0A382G9G9_9ZZZZ